jgi:hypothetical protein
MKYMLLIYSDEKQWETMTPAENQATMQEYFAFTRSIQENGQHLAGEGLQPTTTATTVRVRGGQLQTTDGPFAETREQLGGFYLVDAANLDEAIALAARIPSARVGAIEVRPVMVFEGRPQVLPAAESREPARA